MEEPKTECPECGNIWQEHTINEHDGCMALMDLGLAVALARDAELQGNAAAPTVVLCPVCSKTSLEYTEAAVRSCANKWRKGDRGSTGLELQHAFLEAQFENEEPDPLRHSNRP